MDHDVIYIGMDLGTFKTSVVSSNGRRETMYTAVGYPSDYVARAHLGQDVVFGDDVFEQRMALDIVRPFAKGMLKYQHEENDSLSTSEVEKSKQAARLVVSHAVAATEPPAGVPVYGVIGAPSRASISCKELLIDVASEAFDGVVIVPEPFTVAYGMNRLSETLVVDIGAGTIDICPMRGRFPTDDEQVTIPFGGDMVDERFRELLLQAHPGVQVSEKMAREIKERHGFVHDVNERAEVMLPVGGRPTRIDVTEPLKEACRSLVPPIIEGLCQVIARFDPEFQKPLLQNILIGGGGSLLNGLDQLIEEGLSEFGEIRVTKVYDSVFAGAVGALRLAMAMPVENWQQIRDIDQADRQERQAA
ncbi:MAG: rod shape-determining protein [Planctomycetes bacterium]|nr:rod shape-determining protein [Planctomycetota bacterium]